MNKETLEETAKKYANKIWDYSNSNEKTLNANCKEAFLKGAKWQAKRSYSEEEVLQLLIKFYQFNNFNGTIEEWLKQFKKQIRYGTSN